jgi:hypothetical protein
MRLLPEFKFELSFEAVCRRLHDSLADEFEFDASTAARHWASDTHAVEGCSHRVIELNRFDSIAAPLFLTEGIKCMRSLLLSLSGCLQAA